MKAFFSKSACKAMLYYILRECILHAVAVMEIERMKNTAMAKYKRGFCQHCCNTQLDFYI